LTAVNINRKQVATQKHAASNAYLLYEIAISRSRCNDASSSGKSFN